MEKNLHSKEAITKFKELVDAVGTCMFITTPTDCEHHARPMGVVEVDQDANTWFFSHFDSNKVKNIQINPDVEMIFAHPSKEIYLVVKGRASIETDKKLIRDKWHPQIKAWFPLGVDSPDICLLKIKTDEAHYWTTETGKLSNAIKLMTSVIQGKAFAKGVHGELTL